MYSLYILKSERDGKLYVGIAKNVEERLYEHNQGKVRSTKARRPFIIVYTKSYSTRQQAAREEWLMKHTPGEGKKKRALINQYQANKGR